MNEDKKIEDLNSKNNDSNLINPDTTIKNSEDKNFNFIKICFVIALLIMLVSTLVENNILKTINKDNLWEYEVVYLSATENDEYIQDELNSKEAKLSSGMINSYGQEGWELVDTYLEMETVHPNYGKEDYVTGLQPNVRPHRLVMIFKRPL